MSDADLMVSGLPEDQQTVVSRLYKKLTGLDDRNALLQGLYDMERVGRRVETIAPQYYRLGLTLGWSGKAVDLLSRRCRLDKFVWPDGDVDSLGMREFAESNALRSEIRGAGTSSLIFGPAFLINTVGGEGEAPSLLHVKNARNATGTWNARTRRLDDLLSITRWTDDGRDVLAFALYLTNLTVSCSRDALGARWSVDQQEHSWGMPAEVMVYRQAPGRDFGYSRITPAARALHFAAIRELARLEGHSDVYSYPMMVLFGASEKLFQNADGSQKTAWQIALGRVFGIPDRAPDDPNSTDDSLDRADLKYIQAASPEPRLATLNALAKLFARETSLPDSSFALTDTANPTSADSYVQSREDLIGEAEGATDDWSTPVRRAVVRGLAIQNGLTEVPAEWLSIEPRWRSPVFLSRAAEADAGAKQVAAYPALADTEVGLELLGLDRQQIERVMAERRRLNGRATLDALRSQAGSPALPVPNVGS